MVRSFLGEAAHPPMIMGVIQGASGPVSSRVSDSRGSGEGAAKIQTVYFPSLDRKSVV